jgi:hypothetical protein
VKLDEINRFATPTSPFCIILLAHSYRGRDRSLPSHSIPYTSSCRKYQASIVNHASIPTPYIKSRRTANKNRGKKCYFTELDFAVGEKKGKERKGKVDRKV